MQKPTPAPKRPTNGGLGANGISKSFRGRLVLDEVDLRLEPGRLGLVVGANGVGKTTLLRVFATLLRPDRGSATVDGFDVTDAGDQVRRRIGVALVNERSLYWRLSVRENLELFARTRGVAAKQVSVQVDALLEELHLEETAPRWVADISTGQRQRVIIARSGLGRPTTLLIDEPLRGLDQLGLETVTRFLRTRADDGATVLVVDPTGDGMRPIADAVFVLEDGRLHPSEAGSAQ